MLKAKRLESYLWAMVGVIVTLGLTRTFLEFLSKHAPAPIGGPHGYAESVETFSSLQ